MPIADDIRVKHLGGIREPEANASTTSRRAKSPVMKATTLATIPTMKRLVSIFDAGFLFDQTLEGDAFWRDVYNRLKRILDEGN